MATFDFSKAASIITTSNSPVLDALQVQFGVPQCMMNFAREALEAFPSPVLNSINMGINDGVALADSVFKDITRRVFLDTGIVEYDTNLGRFVFVSSSSNMGVEQDLLQSVNDLYGLGTILGFGAEAWVIGENVLDQIDEIKNCIDQLSSFSVLQKGPSAIADKIAGFSMVDPITGLSVGEFPAPPPALEAASKVFDANKEVMEQASAFIKQGLDQVKVIEDIKQARQKDPKNNPEPVFFSNLINEDPDSPWFGKTLEEALAGNTSFNLIEAQLGPDGLPIVPLDGDINPFTDIVNASGMLPPKSLKGQFLYSKTGVYYDSYGGGLDYTGCISNIVSAVYYDTNGDPIAGTGVPPKMLEWTHEHNPNIGGKGEIVTWSTFNKWADTAFDIDQIDESPQMQEFYDDDQFLQVLTDQRNREIYDLSAYIGELQASGYGEDSALLSNQRQILYAKISTHDSKINRRKKQIQVHVLLSPSNAPAKKGEIPINDFKTLDSGKLAIERGKQETLIFRPGEVSGIVLPLCPEFIKSDIPQDTFTADELLVPPVGVGNIITSDYPVSGTSGTVLSLNDRITTEGLVAIYNFLDADIVKPDSDKYFTINGTTGAASDKPAQIVASSIDSMFPSGIGIPYFRGVCNFFSGVDGDGNPKVDSYTSNNEYLYSPFRPYGYGRIQSGWDDIDSLLYNNRGATFEFWSHVPDLGTPTGLGWNSDNSLSSLHRVVLGCENRGGDFSSLNDNWVAGPQYGSNSVRGLLMGFTRDRRITQGVAPTNNPNDNKITDGLRFHMSPTQSINTSGVTFLAASLDAKYCAQDEIPASGYYGISVDTSTVTSNGDKLNDCSSSFVLTTVTVDYAEDLVSIYLNGNLLRSQSVESVFGARGSPNIPSMVDTKSFSYDVEFKDDLPPNAPGFPPQSLGYRDFWYWNGPVPQGNSGMSLTPWMIGGGYTDGMHTKDLTDMYVPTSNEGMNFMGGKWGGKKSGLHGFLGSLKLYNKAITSSDALKNYNAQKGFFGNIRI